MRGKVKWYDSSKGFGFIETDEGIDVFVQHTGIAKEMSSRFLQEEQVVSFEIMQGKRGPQAINVKILED